MAVQKREQRNIIWFTATLSFLLCYCKFLSLSSQPNFYILFLRCNHFFFFTPFFQSLSDFRRYCFYFIQFCWFLFSNRIITNLIGIPFAQLLDYALNPNSTNRELSVSIANSLSSSTDEINKYADNQFLWGIWFFHNYAYPHFFFFFIPNSCVNAATMMKCSFVWLTRKIFISSFVDKTEARNVVNMFGLNVITWSELMGMTRLISYLTELIWTLWLWLTIPCVLQATRTCPWVLILISR